MSHECDGIASAGDRIVSIAIFEFGPVSMYACQGLLVTTLLQYDYRNNMSVRAELFRPRIRSVD
jgi:hypothetical protein